MPLQLAKEDKGGDSFVRLRFTASAGIVCSYGVCYMYDVSWGGMSFLGGFCVGSVWSATG